MDPQNHRPGRPRVLIVYRTIPQYRRQFYESLRERLHDEGVQLGLLYGQATADERSRMDTVDLAWAVQRRSVVLRLGSQELYWQPCLTAATKADLVIVEQASRLLVNYVLMAAQSVGMTRLALWGHGRTPKATPSSRLGEAAKTAISNHVHWWFAYNDLSARMVRELGYPAERITAVQNAIDTQSLTAAGAAVTDAEVAGLRDRLGLRGENVCVFVGAMYREKRLPFLIAACELLRERIPDFEMLFVGSGPDRSMVEEAVARNDWMRYVGPLFDEEKVPYFRLARLVLMPGRVGLGILDTFALETPMVTTAVPYHAPEVDYLQDGLNGMILSDPDSPGGFADGVAALLRDPEALEGLRKGCRASARRYTVESMADNFAEGVLSALDAPPLPRAVTPARR